MFRRLSVALVVLLLAGYAPFVSAIGILVDGSVQEWDSLASEGNDQLAAVAGEHYFYVRISLPRSVIFQRNNDLRLTLFSGRRTDSPMLTWYAGERRGQWVTADNRVTELKVIDFPIVVSPTFASEHFEIAIPRDIKIGGRPLFQEEELTLGLQSRSMGVSTEVTIASQPVLQDGVLPIDPVRATDTNRPLRLVSWNVLNDGILKRPDHFRRILQLLDPDILALGEVFESSAADVQSRLADWLPQRDWLVVKHTGGSMLATNLQHENTVDIDGDTGDAFLLKLPGRKRSLLLVHAWAACCDEDNERQRQTDAIAAFLRDYRRQLPVDTPIILTGDFNIVSFREPYVTLKEGSGGILADAVPRHTGLPFVYTWRSDETGFTPGRLDLTFYTPETITVNRAFIFNDEGLAAVTLDAWHILPGDTAKASDHLPVVVDFNR